MMIATQLGFPVALKIDSPDISHKSDVQGVVLNIHERHAGARHLHRHGRARAPPAAQRPHQWRDGAEDGAQRRGREVHIGLVTDDPFGPVIVFGAGGTMIELINDRAMELPPLNQFLARRLIDRARVAETLGDWRGASAVNMDALEQLLLRVSEMVCELPQLREMDINPIIVDEDGRGGGGRAHRHRPCAAEHDGSAQRLQPPVHPALPGALRAGLAAAGRWRIHGAPDPPRRRADAAGPGARACRPESRYFRFVSSMTELPPTCWRASR
jgi:acetyltransferase